MGKIYKIESSKSITLGQSDIITVTYIGGSSGCSGTNHLETEIIGNTIIFKGYYHYPIKPTVCPATAPNHILHISLSLFQREHILIDPLTQRFRQIRL